MKPTHKDVSRPALVLLAVIGASSLACSFSTKSAPTVTPQPKVGLVAQGESFSNLTAITENMENCDEPSTTKDGQVIFSCFRENHWDLFLKANPTSSAVQKLTSHGAQDINPAIAPDSSRVAFASNRSGNYDIFIMSMNGGTAKQQVTDTNDIDYSPDWSPDNKMIAYTRHSSIDNQYYIWLKNLENNANIQIGPGLNPKFSPDGKTILFQRASTQGQKWFGLWTMDLSGGSRTQIVSSNDWGAIDASWSPDGERIIFVSSKGVSGRFINEAGSQRVPGQSSNNLWVISADGSGLTQLTTHPKDDIAPHWSDKNFIYFTSWRDGKKRIWRFTPILPDGYVPNTSTPAPIEEPAAPAAPAAEAPSTPM